MEQGFSSSSMGFSSVLLLTPAPPCILYTCGCKVEQSSHVKRYITAGTFNAALILILHRFQSAISWHCEGSRMDRVHCTLNSCMEIGIIDKHVCSIMLYRCTVQGKLLLLITYVYVMSNIFAIVQCELMCLRVGVRKIITHLLDVRTSIVRTAI